MKIKELIDDEEGSAILEFVAIAIPLFIPLVLYMAMLNQSIQMNFGLHNLARQASRAFSTAHDPRVGYARALQVINETQQRDSRFSKSDQIGMVIECSSTPCLVPDSKVTITLSLPLQKLEASNTQVVDAW